MYGTSPKYDFHREYYYEYPELIRRIKQTAEEHGFRGDYLATELNWGVEGPAAGIIFDPSVPWPMLYTQAEAAKYLARAVVLHLGMGVAAGHPSGMAELMPVSYTVVQNLCTVMAGHEAIDVPVEIDIDYEGPVAYCAFRYPNGDRILAVWTDGVAQDEDPGALAAITFPGLVTEAVTGIDVLHGFEQELRFETANENTIIRGLLVKDYPILIRLRDVKTGPNYGGAVGDSFHRLGETQTETETETGYQQGFDSGDAVGWNLRAGWGVVGDSQGGRMLHGQGHTLAVYDGDVWGDSTFMARIKLVKGGIHLNYRRGGCVRYFILFSESKLSISKTAPCGTNTTLRSVSGQFSLQRWYELKVVGVGGKIEVYVDGALRISCTDSDPLLYGVIALETLKDSEAYVDDIAVTCP
jgi:hypothetical protein